MKAEARRQKAEGRRQSGRAERLLTAFCLLLSAFCFLAAGAAAQKRPKPALKESDARRAIAEARGLALRTGAVRVLEVSAAGAAPVTVRAEVTLGLRLARIADERAGGGFLAPKRWRAVELRVGDREWEDFDILARALGAERVEAARRSVEEAVKEFEARVAAAGKGATVEPLTRGALTIKQLSALGSSAVAEVSVEATFRLEGGVGRRWQAAEVSVAGEPGVELAAVAESMNTLKAARAREEMGEIAAALEKFRRERGLYVVAESEVVLMDHLSPRFIRRAVRIDPWHRPYRYAGARDSFTISSDGADGKRGTPDDLTLNSGR